MNQIAAVILRQLYLMRGSFSRVMPIFAFVAVDIVLWGFISKYLNQTAVAGFNFVTAFLSAILLWDFFIRILHGVTLTFFEDVWSRNFLNIFASPISVSEYVFGLVLTSILTSFASLIFMFVLAIGVFHLSFLSYGFALIPFLLILFLFGISFGVLACAVVLRFGPATEWFIWPIPAFLSPFVGVFYPISTLPHWMQIISRLLPASYVFENMRSILQGGSASASDMIIGILLSLIYIGLACWAFKSVYQHAMRTGLIARYSAETLS